VELPVEVINFVVARNHCPRLFRIPAHKRGDRIAQHLQRHVGHPGQVNIRFQLRLGAQHHGTSRHGDRFIPDPLKISRDLHRHGNEPELGRERSFGEQVKRRVIDLDFELVEDVVIRLHLEGERIVPLDEGAHRAGDGGFRMASHRQEALLEVGHFLAVVGHAGKEINRSDRRHTLRSGHWQAW